MNEPGLRVLVVLGNAALNGQERGNIEVFRALKDVGVDALFVTHRTWGHQQIQPALDGLGLRWDAIEYARHFTKRTPLAGWVRNLRKMAAGSWAFWRIAQRYRPTHVHVANPHYFLAVLPALMLMRAPVVYRLGDEPTQHHALYRLLWRRFILPRVSRFVCVSEYVRARLIESGAVPERTRVIYSHPPERPAPAQPLCLDPFDGYTVAYVGQMAAHKGVDVLVEAAIQLCREREDVRFLLAGALRRNDPFALGLFAHVKKAGLGDRIRFLGYVEDVPGLLAQVDLHVLPSVWEEPMANVLVEAKRAGVPSVVFASGGLPELVEDGRDGWVCTERTATALRAGIEHALALGQEELAEAGEAARASLARRGITREAYAHAWKRVFEEAR